MARYRYDEAQPRSVITMQNHKEFASFVKAHEIQEVFVKSSRGDKSAYTAATKHGDSVDFTIRPVPDPQSWKADEDGRMVYKSGFARSELVEFLAGHNAKGDFKGLRKVKLSEIRTLIETSDEDNEERTTSRQRQGERTEWAFKVEGDDEFSGFIAAAYIDPSYRSEVKFRLRATFKKQPDVKGELETMLKSAKVAVYQGSVTVTV